MKKATKPNPPKADNKTDYLCKSCGTVVPRGTHHKMEACECGSVMVDRGWYGTRVLWPGGPIEKWVEEITP